jgi:hypothetical protein
MLNQITFSGFRRVTPSTLVSIQFRSKITLILEKQLAIRSLFLECIRLAILGMFPSDSDEGKSFLFDPFLLSMSATLATIGIEFTIQFSGRLKAQQSYLLTKTSNVAEVKKMQSSLTRFDLCEQSINVRDLDVQIPKLLNLNPAMIDKISLSDYHDSFWFFANDLSSDQAFNELFAASGLENNTKVEDYLKQLSDSLENKRRLLSAALDSLLGENASRLLEKLARDRVRGMEDLQEAQANYSWKINSENQR